MVKENLGTDDFEFISVGSMISEQKLYSEWDDEMNCSIFDEDLVRKEVRKTILSSQRKGKKGVVIEFHSLSFLRKKMLDRVIVLRTDNSVLWNRLEKRGYSEAKIQENVQAEIFMECYNEAVDEFGDEVVELRESNSEQDMKENSEYISRLLVSK
jgi:adenylate kinase